MSDTNKNHEVKKLEDKTSIETIVLNLNKISSGDYDKIKSIKKHDNSDKVGNAVYEVAEHFCNLSEIAYAASIGHYSMSTIPHDNHDDLALSINIIIEKLKGVVAQANIIAGGNYSYEKLPNRVDDELGTALYRMTKALRDLDNKSKVYEKKLRESNRLLTISAATDPLTKISNRLNFTKEFNRCIALSKRKNRICAILLIDIDKFKLINDKLGHTVGDEVLIRLASLLTKSVRSSDRVVRMGGDEFAIILPEINNSNEASLVAKAIISALNKWKIFEGCDQAVEVSIGISCFPESGVNSIDLLKNADSALYLAKHDKKSSFRVC
jgi:diguanylate cyclase (GGDEF)-like protein